MKKLSHRRVSNIARDKVQMGSSYLRDRAVLTDYKLVPADSGAAHARSLPTKGVLMELKRGKKE